MFGDLNLNTMTVAIDSDIILTTEDNIQLFTQLMDHVGTTTEEPLPESVLLQLEQEREERENKRDGVTTTTTTTTEQPNNVTNTKASVTYTTIPLITPGIRSEMRIRGGMEQTKNEPSSSVNELTMAEDTVDSFADMTTFIPMGDQYSSETGRVDYFGSTEKPDLQREEESSLSPMYSMQPMQLELNEFDTESSHLEKSTWLPDVANLVESMQQAEPEMLSTESGEKTTTEFDPSSTTELPNLTTSSDDEENEEITTGLPKLLKMLERTTTIPTAQPTTEPPTTTSSSTTTSNESEATTMPTTTTELPKLQSMVDTTTTTASSITTTSPTPAYTEANTVAETTVETPTTVAPPLPTTQQLHVVPLTRAPRVERIFNSDGVEVLYGYSSVVRTHLD